MTSASKLLPTGYSAVPPGMIANVVTCLDMKQRPRPKPVRPLDRPMVLQRVEKPGIDAYRALFRAVGQDWLWYSRLTMPDDALRRILEDPVSRSMSCRPCGGRSACWSSTSVSRDSASSPFSASSRRLSGRGLGRFLMDQALLKAWARPIERPIERLWVHTCTFDHPAAIGFYRPLGFRALRLRGGGLARSAPHRPFAARGGAACAAR